MKRGVIMKKSISKKAHEASNRACIKAAMPKTIKSVPADYRIVRVSVCPKQKQNAIDIIRQTPAKSMDKIKQDADKCMERLVEYRRNNV